MQLDWPAQAPQGAAAPAGGARRCARPRLPLPRPATGNVRCVRDGQRRMALRGRAAQRARRRRCAWRWISARRAPMRAIGRGAARWPCIATRRTPDLTRIDLTRVPLAWTQALLAQAVERRAHERRHARWPAHRRRAPRQGPLRIAGPSRLAGRRVRNARRHASPPRTSAARAARSTAALGDTHRASDRRTSARAANCCSAVPTSRCSSAGRGARGCRAASGRGLALAAIALARSTASWTSRAARARRRTPRRSTCDLRLSAAEPGAVARRAT